MGGIILVGTATLEPVVVKVFLTLRDRGDTLRMLKHNLKGLPSKSTTFDTHFKRERSTPGMNYESWNKAKKQLSFEEINKRRNTGACMNCGEVGQVSNDSPKPKP